MKYFFVFLLFFLLFQNQAQADQTPLTTETLCESFARAPFLKSNYTRREMTAQNKVYKKMTGIYFFTPPYFLLETRDVKRAYFMGSRDPDELAALTFSGGRATYYTEKEVQLLKAEGQDLRQGQPITSVSITQTNFYIFKYPELFMPEITYRLLMSGSIKMLHEIFYDRALTGNYSKWIMDLIPIYQDLGHVVSYVTVYGKKNKIKRIVVHNINGSRQVVNFS